MVKQKYIALVDCDSFFVSCEQKKNPSLKNKPISVLSNKDGCVISRSKEAKLLGIKMGEPYFMAKAYKECKFIVADHEYYSKVSKQIMTLLKDFSPYVQDYSIDEAFVDLTGLKRLYSKNYKELAIYIRTKIKNEIDIPVSIGISYTKTLAKLASDKAKHSQNGIYIISKSEINKELSNTNIEEIWGIGRRLTKRLKQAGIITAEELVNKGDDYLGNLIGINGIELRHELLGEMVSEITNETTIPKSIQNTRAFGIFTSDINFIKNELNWHIHTSCSKLRTYNTKCNQISVMLRTKDFKVYYAKKDLIKPIDFEIEISKIALQLLEEIYNPKIVYRSVGVILSKIGEENTEQLSLYTDNTSKEKTHNLATCIDNIERKFGKNTITTGFIK